jgi:hypothetical protein
VALRVGIVGSDAEARAALVRALDRAPVSWSLSLYEEVPEDVDVVVCDPGIDAPDAIVISDDGSCDPIEQITSRFPPGGHALLVTSASGGTGATSIALHLAAELATRGKSVCFLDRNEEWGVRGRLGMDPTEIPLAPVPVAPGFRIVSGSVDVAEVVKDYEHTIIDAPHHVLGTLSGRVREGLFVIAPTPEGVRRAERVLEAHAAISWKVIANRLGPGGETTCEQLSRMLERPVIELPCCPALRDAEDDYRLMTGGWSRWSRKIRRVADGVTVAR